MFPVYRILTNRLLSPRRPFLVISQKEDGEKGLVIVFYSGFPIDSTTIQL
jgi:hypothetical protein